MAENQATAMELTRLAMRAKLGIDGDARLSEPEPESKPRKTQAPRDIEPEDLTSAEVTKAKEEGRPIEAIGPESTTDPLIIKRRLDGKLKGQPLTEEFKTALRDAYADDLGLNIEALAKATGISAGAIAGALWEAPKTLAAARQKRAEAAHDAMEQALYLMAVRLRDAVAAGDVVPSSKTIRDFMVGFGILTDKLALMSGAPTARLEVLTETLDERKARLTAILDKADAAIGLLTSGRKVNGGHNGPQ